MNYTDPNILNSEIMQKHVELYSTQKTTHAVIVLWMGRRFKTSKGKSVWRSVGHAKAAFRLHLEGSGILGRIHAFTRPQTAATPYEQYHENNGTAAETSEFIKQHIAAGTLQFEELL